MTERMCLEATGQLLRCRRGVSFDIEEVPSDITKLLSLPCMDLSLSIVTALAKNLSDFEAYLTSSSPSRNAKFEKEVSSDCSGNTMVLSVLSPAYMKSLFRSLVHVTRNCAGDMLLQVVKILISILRHPNGQMVSKFMNLDLLNRLDSVVAVRYCKEIKKLSKSNMHSAFVQLAGDLALARISIGRSPKVSILFLFVC